MLIDTHILIWVLEKKYGEKLPQVVCNPQQLGQVFLNLLVNASQAIPDHGTITVKTYSESGWIKVAVSDTGAGIPEEIKNKIFEPFFTTKDASKGTGLGLSICADIVKNHGGTISAESQAGRGTTFTVALPLAS